METSKSSGGNVGSLAFVKVLTAITGALVQVFLGRYLGAASYGAYGYLKGIFTVFAGFVGFSLHEYQGREIARDPDGVDESLRLGLATTAWMGLPVVGFMAALVWVMDGRPFMIAGAVIMGLSALALGLANVPVGLFLGLRRLGLQVWPQIWGRMVLVVMSLGLVWAGWGVIGALLGHLSFAIVVLAGVLWVYGRRVGPIGLNGDLTASRALIRHAWPFGVSAIMGALYLSSDVLILKAFAGDTEVGLYSAAAVISLQVGSLVVVFTQGAYPVLAQLVGQPERAGESIRFMLRVLLVAGIPLAVGGIQLAEPLLVWVMGAAYEDAALPFAILMVMVPFRYAKNALGVSLSALDYPAIRARGSVIATILNVSGNLALIPFYGAVGAAVMTTVSELVVLIYFGFEIRKVATGLGWVRSLLKTSIAALVMAVAVWGVSPWLHVGLVVCVGAVVYGLLSNIMGLWSKSDLKRIRSL